MRRVTSGALRFGTFGAQALDVRHVGKTIVGTSTNQESPSHFCSLFVFTFEQYSSAWSQKMVWL